VPIVSSVLRRVAGRSFHARRPATANDLSSKVLLQSCMTQTDRSADLSVRRPDSATSSDASVRYALCNCTSENLLFIGGMESDVPSKHPTARSGLQYVWAKISEISADAPPTWHGRSITSGQHIMLSERLASASSFAMLLSCLFRQRHWLPYARRLLGRRSSITRFQPY